MKHLILIVLGLLVVSSTVYGNQGIVNSAITEIGKGEIGGNNRGSFVKQVNRGLEDSWCAGFVSYILYKNGYKSIGYNLRARDIFRKGIKVKSPKPGDIICFKRGRNENLGHVGIVEKVTTNSIITIEGNKGNYPSKVKRFSYPRNGIKDLLGFVRVNN